MKLIALLCLVVSVHVHAETLMGRVVGVADGDTLTVLDSNKGLTKIRLHQIDAPEKKQDFGQRSKQSLSELVYGKQVRVEVFGSLRPSRAVTSILSGGIASGMAHLLTPRLR